MQSTTQSNGKVERFIRTSTEEWAYGRSYRHSRVRAQALRVWLDYYNLVRRHTAIGRRTPLPHLVELMVTNVLENAHRIDDMDVVPRRVGLDDPHRPPCGQLSRLGRAVVAQ